MAEASVAVTAGSGTNLHTNSRTINSTLVHDEFGLPGEFPYACYTVTAVGSIATANDHVLQIMAGSSLNVKIRRIRLEQSAVAGTAAIGSFDILRLTTAGTGGSSVTPAKLDNADAAAGATAMTVPSAKGTESTIIASSRMHVRSAVSTTGSADDAWEWVQLPNSKPIVIAAGTSNGIAVKSLTAITGASLLVYVEFVEQNFV